MTDLIRPRLGTTKKTSRPFHGADFVRVNTDTIVTQMAETAAPIRSKFIL